jgi:hypothetical protein
VASVRKIIALGETDAEEAALLWAIENGIGTEAGTDRAHTSHAFARDQRKLEINHAPDGESAKERAALGRHTPPWMTPPHLKSPLYVIPKSAALSALRHLRPKVNDCQLKQAACN